MLVCYDQIMRKKPLPVLLDDKEREILEALAEEWGLSLAGAIRRLIRESEEYLS